MAMTEFKLLAETENADYSYSVTVDEAVQGLVRLVVSRTKENSNEPEVFQGVDLNAEEREALGKHLIALSERLNKYRV